MVYFQLRRYQTLSDAFYDNADMLVVDVGLTNDNDNDKDDDDNKNNYNNKIHLAIL